MTRPSAGRDGFDPGGPDSFNPGSPDSLPIGVPEAQEEFGSATRHRGFSAPIAELAQSPA